MIDHTYDSISLFSIPDRSDVYSFDSRGVCRATGISLRDNVEQGYFLKGASMMKR